MFRIKRIYGDDTQQNRQIVKQVQAILSDQFKGISAEEIARFPEYLRNPVRYRFRSVLFIADDGKDHVRGFALLHHAPDLHFCFLDYISAASHRTGTGIGGALYGDLREYARGQKAIGLFLECLPDDPDICMEDQKLKQNSL